MEGIICFSVRFFNNLLLVLKMRFQVFSFANRKIQRFFSNRKILKARAIYYQIFVFSPNENLSKTTKNVFYFIKKALFVLEIFNFLYFFPFFPHFPDSKRQMKLEWFMTSWIGLDEFADVIFGITQKLLYITSSNLVR